MDAPKGITSDVVERLKAALGPEPAEATPEETPEGTPEGEPEPQPVRSFKVKVDGEEVEVPEDELLKGYSRTSDYTKKTQRLAEERKAFEAEAAAVKSEREQYSKALSALQEHLQASKEPNWDQLESQDPIEFVKQKELWRDRRERVALIEAERRRIADQQAAEQQQAFNKYLEAEQSKLLDALPQWKKDAKKAQAEREMIANLALDAGYSEAEISQIYDHRAVLIMRKAALYDEMMSKAKSQSEKVRDAPKTAPPGNLQPASGAKEFAAARQTLRERGRVDDFASAFKILQRKQ